MRSKSMTVEGASTEHVDQETNKEMHEASTQDVQPLVRATHRPSKYLDVWDLPDDQVIELLLNSMHQPVDEGARAFIGFLGTIAQKPYMCLIRYLNWRDMPEELKEECWCLVEAKADGCLVERAILYSILHTRKDEYAVNEVVQAKMELLAEPSNQLQSDDTSGSIAWALDNVFAKVMSKERKGRICGVGFGPSPSGRSNKSALTDLQI
nr:hypothetical protein CFP56_53829 [Quercus suber]